MLHDHSSGNGVSFSSGGVAEPAPSSDTVTPIHARFLLYLCAGACIVSCSSHASGRSPLKVDKLGFLVVSMQGQLCGANSDLTRMSLIGQEIMALRGQECSGVIIVDQAQLNRAAAVTASAAHRVDQGSQRVAHSAALASLQQSLVLQLRLLLRSAEHAFGGSSPSSPSLLSTLNAEHQRLMDAMLQSDDIHKQMQDAAPSQTSDPLSNTRTIPEMQRYEEYVQSVMQRGDLQQRWLSQLCAKPEASSGAKCVAAHLIALAAAAAPASSAPVLLSHTVPAFAALNLTGPSNAGVWNVVTEYARALCARRAGVAKNAGPDAATSSCCIAISFPLMTPPLRVYLCALDLPAVEGGGCVVVSEIGPALTTSPPIDSQRLNRSAALLSAQWLDAGAIVAAESFASASPSALLPVDHPLTLAQLRHPRPFAVVESEAGLAPWRTQQEGVHEELSRGNNSSSAWNHVVAAARLIELDCALPAPGALATPITVPALSSPTLSPLVSVSSLSSASPQSPEETQQPVETAPLQEQQQRQQQQTQPSGPKPSPPPPRPNPPPSGVVSSTAAGAATELSGAGTASFRMRKMHAATGPNSTATAVSAPPGLRPHPPTMAPHPPPPALPLAPLIGAPRVPSLPLSQGAAAVELSMDTPRLETSHAATPRVVESAATKPAPPSGSGLFPPVDKRDSSAVAPSTLLSKLQPSPDGSF